MNKIDELIKKYEHIKYILIRGSKSVHNNEELKVLIEWIDGFITDLRSIDTKVINQSANEIINIKSVERLD